MKKITIAILVCISLIVFVSAYTLSLSNASFTSVQPSGITMNEGTLTYKCDGKLAYKNISEPNMDFDDEIEMGLLSECKGTITDLCDWTQRCYKENAYGLKSFDEVKLKENACSMQNATYDSNTNDCVEPVADIGVGL